MDNQFLIRDNRARGAGHFACEWFVLWYAPQFVPRLLVNGQQEVIDMGTAIQDYSVINNRGGRRIARKRLRKWHLEIP
jgi:hypothetical protein